MDRDNATGAANQQERLDAYLAGFVDGEGTFHVAVCWIRENHRGSRDTTLVFVVRRRIDLLVQVIPFFEANPLLSSKQQEFVTFAGIVRAMAAGEHLSLSGFEALKARAVTMNGGGWYRRVHRG